MKDDWIITFRSVTYGQWGKRVLDEAQIKSYLLRTPGGLSKRGCGYCLQIKGRQIRQAAALLAEKKVPMGKIYEKLSQGHWEERLL